MEEHSLHKYDKVEAYVTWFNICERPQDQCNQKVYYKEKYKVEIEWTKTTIMYSNGPKTKNLWISCSCNKHIWLAPITSSQRIL